MDHDQRPPHSTSPKPSLENVKLFAKHGPRWMILCMLVERFPYKTALGIASAFLMWKVHGH